MLWKGENHRLVDAFYDYIWLKCGSIDELISPNIETIYDKSGEFTQVMKEVNTRAFLRTQTAPHFVFFRMRSSFNQIVVEYHTHTAKHTDIFTINDGKIVRLKMIVE